MDFGLLYELGVPRPWNASSERNAYWNALREVVEAEKVGFTHVWAVEHHFLEEFSHSSAPEIWLASVAQHTSKIRIGHGVVLLPVPFNHPVRVAERIAALDIMSNGRVEFGTGRSITHEELGGFRIDPGDSRPMWLEALELISRLWAAEAPISFHGKYVQLEDRMVVPRPLQKPHPPVWLACTSPGTYALAGERGTGVLAFGQAVGPDAMSRRINEYRTALASADPIGGVINDNVAVFLMGFCAETDDTARAIAEESLTWYADKTMEYFLQWGRGGQLPPGYEWYADVSKIPELASRMKFDYLFEHGMILCGSPETICKQIEAFRVAGANQILMGSSLHTISHESVMSSIRLMGERVIPEFRDAPTQRLGDLAVAHVRLSTAAADSPTGQP